MITFLKAGLALSLAGSLCASDIEEEKDDTDVIIGGPYLQERMLSYQQPEYSRLEFYAEQRLWKTTRFLPHSVLTSYLTDGAWKNELIGDIAERKLRGVVKNAIRQTGRDFGLHAPGIEEMEEYRIVHWFTELFHFERSSVDSPSVAKPGEEYFYSDNFPKKLRSIQLNGGLDVGINPKLWGRMRYKEHLFQVQARVSEAEIFWRASFSGNQRGSVTVRTTLEDYKPENIAFSAGIDYRFGRNIQWDDTKPNLALSMGIRYRPFYEKNYEERFTGENIRLPKELFFFALTWRL